MRQPNFHLKQPLSRRLSPRTEHVIRTSDFNQHFNQHSLFSWFWSLWPKILWFYAFAMQGHGFAKIHKFSLYWFHNFDRCDWNSQKYIIWAKWWCFFLQISQFAQLFTIVIISTLIFGITLHESNEHTCTQDDQEFPKKLCMNEHINRGVLELIQSGCIRLD